MTVTRTLRSTWVPGWSVLGLIVSTPVLAWWSMGSGWSQFPDHEYGPYEFSPTLIGVVRSLAILIAVTAVGAGLLPAVRRRVHSGLHLGAVACLMAAGVVGAVGWRIQTSGVVGANIGGGFVFLAGPPVIAGLGAGAVLVEERARGRPVPAHAFWLGAALSLAPLLWVVQFALSLHEESIGVIRESDYASVRVGQSRDAVRARLGESLRSPVDWFFPPLPPGSGSTCDYYKTGDVQAATVYQICYSNSAVVSATVSHSPYTG